MLSGRDDERQGEVPRSSDFAQFLRLGVAMPQLLVATGREPVATTGHGTGGSFGCNFTRASYSVVSTSFTTPRLISSFSDTSPKSFVSTIHLSSASDISFRTF